MSSCLSSVRLVDSGLLYPRVRCSKAGHESRDSPLLRCTLRTALRPELRGYDIKLPASDSHTQSREAARQFKASVKQFQQQLQARLTCVDPEEGCGSAASEADHELEHEPTITPATFSRRLLLSTDQPLDVPVIMLLNRLYHAESKVLQASHDCILGSMLDGVDSGDAFHMRELHNFLSGPNGVARTDIDVQCGDELTWQLDALAEVADGLIAPMRVWKGM